MELFDWIEEKLFSQARWGLKGGFVAVCAMCILSVAFLVLRTFTGIEQAWAFNIGADMLGIYICAMIYYSVMQASDDLEEHTVLFIVLLMSIGVGFFLDECCWLVQGVASLRLANLWANVLFYANGITIIYMFWRYINRALSLDNKAITLSNKIINALFIPALMLCFANLVVPVYFSVDAAGVYRRGDLYPLSLVFMFVTIPAVIIGLVTSKATRKEKLVMFSFVILPIVGQIAAACFFGISIQQADCLLSVVLIYGVIVADRGKRLQATRTELNMAGQIQASMMPQIFPPFPERPEFDIYATMEPAKGVGGDFYDFFLIDDDHLCVIMADVSGKGIPASLFMMVSKIILKNCAMLGSDKSAAEILSQTNEAICSNNQQDMFVTVWLGILEISTGTLTAANAGHEYPVYKRPGRPYELVKDKHGLVIGIMDGVMYRDYQVQLEPGTKLFLYTDGVPEAMDAQEHMYGVDRMLAALNEAPEATPMEALGCVRRSLSSFVQEAEQFDDITMLCLEYKGLGQCEC